MNHESAGDHWSDSRYAFCKRCFMCYRKDTGVSHTESGDVACCPGFAKGLSKVFEKQFKETGSFHSPDWKTFFLDDSFLDDVSGPPVFIVTRLY